MPKKSPFPTKRVALRGLLLFVIVLFCVGALATSFMLGYRRGGGSSPLAPANILSSKNDAGTTPTDFGLFWEAWNTINQRFYGDTDENKRVDGAISGMVASLEDPYTVYLRPDQNKMFQDDLQGNFGGIGAQLSVKEGKLTVVSVLPGTPAEHADLRSQDIISEVDGHQTGTMTFDEAINAIRGEKGTEVKLTIVRSGKKDPFTVAVKRDTIVVKSIETDTIGPDEQTAYIKVNQFGDDTSQLLQAAFSEARDTHKKAMVLDLRGNPGGYLEAAIQVVGMLIPEHPTNSQANLKDRVAVLERDKQGGEQKHATTTKPILADLPMVVLVNGGSASASEIVAGALKDYNRATIVGEATFGKGSVQELRNLSNGGSIKVTVAKWFTPLGTGIDGKGIDPDVIVTLPTDTEPSTTDAQVQKALDILHQ